MQHAENRLPPVNGYVLDSFALLAYFEAESGSDQVRKLLESAQKERCHFYLCIINLGEIVYIVERERGLPKAQEVLARIDELPVETVDVDRHLTLAAAHLQTDSPIAYADCFAAALSQIKNAILVTGDSEFRKIKTGHNIQIEWLML
jgi:predicted nucleic acid-binding protein